MQATACTNNNESHHPIVVGQLPANYWPLCFSTPCTLPKIGRKRAVGLGEHCLSTQPHGGSCELRSPARLSLIEETRRAANRGRIFFDYFLLATQKKVISRRAAPGKLHAPASAMLGYSLSLES